MLRILASFALVLALTSCSKGSDSPSGGGGTGGSSEPILSNCKGVITPEKVASYNASQSQFRIITGGGTAHCESTRNENGNETHEVVDGALFAEILPRLRYVDASAQDARNVIVKAKLLLPSTDEINAIAATLGVDVEQLQVQAYRPSYIRFGKGALFLIANNSDDGSLLTMRISAENEKQALLLRGMQNFLNTLEGLEVLWNGDAGVFHRQIFAAREGWSDVSAIALLKSSIRDADGQPTRSDYQLAISRVSMWHLDPRAVNNELRELYSFADNDWRNPSINVSSATDLVDSLRYLVAVNPQHPRAEVLTTYNRIRGFDGTSETLTTAFEYVSGRTFQPAQFDELVRISNVLVDRFNVSSWRMALAIALRTNYDTQQDTDVSSLAYELAVRDLLSRNNPNDDLIRIYGKISAGLTPALAPFYFGTFDYFRKTNNASKDDSERACDQLVLSGKLKEANFAPFVNFVSWLQNTAYVRFPEAIDFASKMSTLEIPAIELFKASYNFLVDAVYVSRTEALQKAAGYLGRSDFNSATLDRLKSYYNWLVNSIYLSRPESLNKAEAAVLGGALSPAQIQSIQDLANWMINEVYFSRPDSLDKAQNLVIKNRLSVEQVDLLKTSWSWLVNSIYLSRPDAFNKASGWVGIMRDQFDTLKSLTDWYINQIYLSRPDSLARAEKLVKNGGLNPDQAALLKDCALWIINNVYLSRTDSAARAEQYVTVNNMSLELYKQLVVEFKALSDHGTPRDQALKQAAKKVLGAN